MALTFFQSFQQCVGDDDRTSEVASPGLRGRVGKQPATIWDTNNSYTSVTSGIHPTPSQQGQCSATSGIASGIGAGIGRHGSHASLSSLEARRLLRPQRPTAQVDREKQSYSVDLLEYLCSSIEQLSYNMEELQKVFIPDRGSSMMMSASPHASKTSIKTLGIGIGMSTGVGLPGELSTGRNSHLESHTLSSQMATGSIHSKLPSNIVPGSKHSSDTSSAMMRCSKRMVDKQWPASIQIRHGLEQNGMAVNKDKVRTMMERALKESKRDHLRKRWKGHTDLGCVEKNLLSMKDPNSKFVRLIDMVSMLALINDCLVTPYVLAWNLSATLFLKTIAIFSALYWTMFMGLKFRTGFYEDGELKMGQAEIIKRYLRTTFLIDITLTILDWSVVFMPQNEADGNVRLIKLLRTAKIFRLARVWELVETLVDQYAPEGTSSKLVIRLGQVMISTLIFTHIMACAWFSVGKDGQADTNATWIDTFQHHSQATNLYEYVTCFHWTLAQLTLGSIDIYPVNSVERLFNVGLLFAGIIFNATIVSLISSQAVEFIANRRDQNLKIQLLKRFLEQHKVDTKLAVRVQRQVLDRIRSADALISEDAVQALSLMSSTLKAQLLYETRLPHMLGHALFRVWYETDEHALRSLCENAVSFEIYKSNDCVFLPGEQAEGMVQVADGMLRYTQDPETSREADHVEVLVKEGGTICEAGLWSSWTHVGKMEAVRTCELLGIMASQMINLLNAFPLVGHITRQYGRAFHLRITCARPPFSRWPSDVDVPHTNASDLLAQDIGLELLRRERVKDNGAVRNMPEDDYQELVSEVEREKCAIEANVDGTLERIVALVAVRIERAQDSRILAEVGKVDVVKKVITASCALPGAKRPRGELPHQTWERLVTTDLKFLAPGLMTTSSETVVEIKESQHFGLLTKYLRTVQHAVLNPDFELPDMPQVYQALPQPDTPFSAETARSSKSRKDRARRLSASNITLARAPSQRQSSEIQQDQEEPFDDMSDEPVLLHEGGAGKIKLYCWLHEATFNFFKSDSGKIVLEKWVKSMDLFSKVLESDIPLANIEGANSLLSFTVSPADSQQVIVATLTPPLPPPLCVATRPNSLDRAEIGHEGSGLSAGGLVKGSQRDASRNPPEVSTTGTEMKTARPLGEDCLPDSIIEEAATGSQPQRRLHFWDL